MLDVLCLAKTIMLNFSLNTDITNKKIYFFVSVEKSIRKYRILINKRRDSIQKQSPKNNIIINFRKNQFRHISSFSQIDSIVPGETLPAKPI